MGHKSLIMTLRYAHLSTGHTLAAIRLLDGEQTGTTTGTSEAELARRTSGKLAGRPVSFASAEDTILAKLEWCRDAASDRQYADARGIIQLHGAALDWNHLERWADDLGVRDLLDRARRGDPA